MKVLTVLILIIPLIWAKHEDLNQQWGKFKEDFGKKYSNSSEEEYRKNIFIENKKKIDNHNYNHEKGKTSFTLKLNQFGDITTEEFKSKFNTVKVNDKALKGAPYSPPSGAPPDVIDWRKKGAVTPIRDQDKCGISSAYSVTGSLEGQHFIKTKKLVQLSEQNLIDCVDPEGGSWEVDRGFQYVIDNNGIDTSESYPNNCSKTGECKFNKNAVGATCTGYVDLPTGDENALKNVVGNIGPVSVAFDASHFSFQFYHAGVYEEPECQTDNPGHSAVVVGYSNDEGVEYWLVKNSFGYDWGTEGYMKMARNKKNHCGIASRASYPKV